MKKVRKPTELKKHRNTIKACIAIVIAAYCRHNATLKSRSREEQMLLGNFLTVSEQEIKDELKKLL